jgi:hypothetical protein
MSIVTSAVPINTTAANIYASAGSTAITWLSLTNTTGSNVLANVHVVSSGGSPSADNIILANIQITEGDTYQLYQAGEKLLLDTGDTIRANTTGNIAAVVSYTTI